ncbi:MAG: HAMP domain-containing histidine kinase [Elusimicrobia bacterium]|nr:HAMP domain-containing histidine kinase [Elusimicrobiota bacterium]
MSDRRRGTYFAFQGLFMAVLLLIFLYQYQDFENWVPRFVFLLSVLGASLALIRTASRKALSHGWFQTALFLGDAGLASLTLHWAQPQSDLYLLYFIVIFGTALTRSFTQSFIVAMITSLLYIFSGWTPAHGFPQDTDFWLRVLFLWVTSSLMAILSRDTQQFQKEHERRYLEHTIQMERLATLGQVAGEVAHRIKGPLTTILVNTEVLTHRAGLSGEMQRQVDRIQEEAHRCKEIVKGLLDLGRIEEISFSLMDLRAPIRSAIKAVEPRLKEVGARLDVQGLERPAKVRGDQSLLHEAIVAVLQNAVEAVRGSGGVMRLELKDGDDEPWWKRLMGRPRYAVVIEDDGKGIAQENIEKVFQPFFTTKKDGSGLGLSAALRILQKHHGSIEAQSEGPGQGTRFTLSLPKPAADRKPRRRKS